MAKARKAKTKRIALAAGVAAGAAAVVALLTSPEPATFTVIAAPDQFVRVTDMPLAMRADLTGDGVVNGADLAQLQSAWGSSSAAADLNDDGDVNGADLANLLSVFGWRHARNDVGDSGVYVIAAAMQPVIEASPFGAGYARLSWFTGHYSAPAWDPTDRTPIRMAIDIIIEAGVE